MEDKGLSERLREAREKAGFRSAADAARSIGINPVTYTAHENGGREYDRKAAILYGAKFGVDPSWLLLGSAADPDADTAGGIGPVLTTRIKEIDMRRIGADGEITKRSHEYAARDHLDWTWEIPTEYLTVQLRIDPAGAVMISVVGDSMYDPQNPGAPGSLFPCDRVIIDTSDKTPSPPGMFAVHDGVGVTVKMVEVVPNSRPLMLKIMSRNPRYASYDVKAEDLRIIGRVRGRFTSL